MTRTVARRTRVDARETVRLASLLIPTQSKYESAEEGRSSEDAKKRRGAAARLSAGALRCLGAGAAPPALKPCECAVAKAGRVGATRSRRHALAPPAHARVHTHHPVDHSVRADRLRLSRRACGGRYDYHQHHSRCAARGRSDIRSPATHHRAAATDHDRHHCSATSCRPGGRGDRRGLVVLG